ncbi:MAG: hypothetical protein ACFE9L_18875, partial [Candidatus Hodarchaeota archaeon]
MKKLNTIESKIFDILSTILDSIPINCIENIFPLLRQDLVLFSELTGIPLESLDSFRKMAALLILNRLIFISKFESV